LYGKAVELPVPLVAGVGTGGQLYGAPGWIVGNDTALNISVGASLGDLCVAP
jgi:hypothetical protein